MASASGLPVSMTVTSTSSGAPSNAAAAKQKASDPYDTPAPLKPLCQLDAVVQQATIGKPCHVNDDYHTFAL